MKPADFLKTKDLLKSKPDNFYIHLNSKGYIFDCHLDCDICPFADGLSTDESICLINSTDTLTPRQLDNVKQLFPEQFI